MHVWQIMIWFQGLTVIQHTSILGNVLKKNRVVNNSYDKVVKHNIDTCISSEYKTQFIHPVSDWHCILFVY